MKSNKFGVDYTENSELISEPMLDLISEMRKSNRISAKIYKNLVFFFWSIIISVFAALILMAT